MLACFLLTTATAAQGASLSIADRTLSIGEVVSTPVSFTSGGQPVSGIQFDIQWDPALNLQIIAGAGIGQSSKVLYTASRTANSIRCLIIGMNQSILAEGDLVQVFVTAGAGAAPEPAAITITNAIASDPDGNAIPVQPSVANIALNAGLISQALPPQGILNAASWLPSPAAPGEIMTLLGAFPAGTPTVLFNGTPAPVIYAAATEVSAIVPFGLDLNRPAEVQVLKNNQRIATQIIPVAPAAPAILTDSVSGTGPALVFNQDCTRNSSSNPAFSGSILVVYGTGFGALNPPALDGRIQTVPASTVVPVTATIGGIPAVVTYAGSAPGSIAGVFEVNVLVPAIAASSGAPLVVTAGSASSQPGVTVSVQ